MNNTLNTIFDRTSLRRYQDKSISADDLSLVKKAIIQAPTAGNMMLYSVLSITDKETKEVLSRTCDNQGFIATAPLILVFLADMNKIYKYFDYCDVENYARAEGKDYKHGGHASLFLSISDTLVAAQNAVIAAESLGIGSCYIGDIIEKYEEHRELLNLPDDVFPIGMLTLGYYPKDFKKVYRKRYDEKYIFFDDKYRDLSEEEFTDMYSVKTKDILNKEVHKVDNFGQLLYKRKFGSEFFEEMNRSVAEILKHWK